MAKKSRLRTGESFRAALDVGVGGGDVNEDNGQNPRDAWANGVGIAWEMA